MTVTKCTASYADPLSASLISISSHIRWCYRSVMSLTQSVKLIRVMSASESMSVESTKCKCSEGSHVMCCLGRAHAPMPLQTHSMRETTIYHESDRKRASEEAGRDGFQHHHAGALVENALGVRQLPARVAAAC